MSMEEKVKKLQIATEEAKKHMDRKKIEVNDSLQRLTAAKALLKQLSPEDQQKIKVNDTKLPELIGLHQLATEALEEATSRYETNSKYLTLFQAKLEQE